MAVKVPQNQGPAFHQLKAASLLTTDSTGLSPAFPLPAVFPSPTASTTPQDSECNPDGQSWTELG